MAYKYTLAKQFLVSGFSGHKLNLLRFLWQCLSRFIVDILPDYTYGIVKLIYSLRYFVFT